MARPWSYGVARQREGSRQNSIGAKALSLTMPNSLLVQATEVIE